ncbi:MAG: carboxypeptidase-like regulatory domain-containing protein [Williamsia sp.]|nr:carboxypeptidase-like regulatory domain-containing protein [Williamsia sp.]
MHCTKYFILLCFLFISTGAWSQFQLKGRIVADATGTPLGAASVFLSNTSIGTTTDKEGNFSLWVPSGKYDLVASFVGYETYTRTISEALTDVLVVKLKPKAEELDEVVVGGYEKDGWKKWGSFFLRNFIGTSDWAADCQIKNYDVIRFRNNKKTRKLSAVALDQLVIENKALGYTVRYQLETFDYDFESDYLLYVGYPLFIPMEGNKNRQARWERRRQEAYTGSIMQFMRAVYRNRIREEGYEVRRLVKTPNEEKKRVRELYRTRVMKDGTISYKGFSEDSIDYYRTVLSQPNEISTFSPYTISGDSIAYGVDSLTAGLEFSNYLHIYYTKAAPPQSYQQLSQNNKKMMSELMLINGQPIQIRSNGNFYPPTNLLSMGYWAWSEKVANMLPFDYKPPPAAN